MTFKTSKKSLSIAVGAALGASLALSPMVLADTNPFGATELSGGYMQIASSHAGEGKCGGDESEGEGSGGGDESEGEGSGGDDKSESEGSCGGGKTAEGSCGGH